MKPFEAEEHLREMRGSTTDIILDHLETFGAMTTDDLTTTISVRFPDLIPETVRRTLYRLMDRGVILQEDEDWWMLTEAA